jgi:hypothetical protein
MPENPATHPAPAFTAADWPIATCLHGFATVGRDGTALHDADAAVWDRMFADIAREGFTLAELALARFKLSDSLGRGVCKIVLCDFKRILALCDKVGELLASYSKFAGALNLIVVHFEFLSFIVTLAIKCTICKD